MSRRARRSSIVAKRREFPCPPTRARRGKSEHRLLGAMRKGMFPLRAERRLMPC